MPEMITRVAEVPPPDSLEAKMLIGAAKEVMPEFVDGVLAGNGLNGLLVGAMAGKACAMLPDGARVLRVVVVASLP
jgi:hypothetical protein